jgi:hypothetical protein
MSSSHGKITIRCIQSILSCNGRVWRCYFSRQKRSRSYPVRHVWRNTSVHGSRTTKRVFLPEDRCSGHNAVLYQMVHFKPPSQKEVLKTQAQIVAAFTAQIAAKKALHTGKPLPEIIPKLTLSKMAFSRLANMKILRHRHEFQRMTLRNLWRTWWRR